MVCFVCFPFFLSYFVGEDGLDLDLDLDLDRSCTGELARDEHKARAELKGEFSLERLRTLAV